jgi:hypothetical protein
MSATTFCQKKNFLIQSEAVDFVGKARTERSQCTLNRRHTQR